MTSNVSVIRRLDAMLYQKPITIQPTYEETLQLWYTHYEEWQANIDSHDAYQAYIAVVDELALELDTDPNLPCNGDTEDMLSACAASYGRDPSATNFCTLSGMMLYHQHCTMVD